ncbi:hypothetical protein D3C86_1161330 [compost metagenome]
MLSALVSWDKTILEDSGALKLIELKLPDIFESATEISSSASTGAIHSLVLAYNILDPEQRKTLHSTMERILSIAGNTGSPPIGFISLYSSILYLIDTDEPVYQRNKLSLDFQAFLELLFDALVGVWRKAPTHPLIFTTFSFPPKTSPSEVLTYNWCYASIKLALALNRMDELSPALDVAQQNPMLSSPILKARVTESVFLRGVDEQTSAALATTIYGLKASSDYYRIVPIVLTSIGKMNEQWRRKIATQLVISSLRFGPSLVDCAVFSTYLNFGYDALDISLPDIDSYYNRTQAEDSKEIQDTTIVPLLAIRQRHLESARSSQIGP